MHAYMDMHAHTHTNTHIHAHSHTHIDYLQVITKHTPSPAIGSAVSNLRSILITGKSVLKSVTENKHRSSKFRSPIRIAINDLQIQYTKLAHAIATIHSPADARVISNAITPGQEHALKGDKAYFGHGACVDVCKGMRIMHGERVAICVWVCECVSVRVCECVGGCVDAWMCG